MAEGTPIPSSIIIVGSGVFGLSTALALASRPAFARTRITVLDRAPFPAPDGASIDSSRIVRADYTDAAYAALGAAAQDLWRHTPWGADGRYEETGLVFTADPGGEAYVRASLQNVMEINHGRDIEVLHNREEIARAARCAGTGASGYVNWRSGWADAERAMRYCRRRVEETRRVECRTAVVRRLIIDHGVVKGVELAAGDKMLADLVVVAAGAWSGKLVDLRGRAQATGQVLAYVDLTAEEQERLTPMPVSMNMSTGMFIISPRNRVLKVARHAYGYTNLVRIPHPEKPGEFIQTSLPRTQVDEPGQQIPAEGARDCRRMLREMVPELGDRPWSKSRICWYNDTPTGDFLITYHPNLKGLFIATGGSGHGFKFLPVIGERIVDVMEHKPPPEFKEKWKWPAKPSESTVTEDGSRSGAIGMSLDTELQKYSKI